MTASIVEMRPTRASTTCSSCWLLATAASAKRRSCSAMPTIHLRRHSSVPSALTSKSRQSSVKTSVSNCRSGLVAVSLVCISACYCLNCAQGTRDVPDIRFRFRLAGYPAIFGYPVPVPVPAKILVVAGYCSRIIYLFNGAKKRYFRKSKQKQTNVNKTQCNNFLM